MGSIDLTIACKRKNITDYSFTQNISEDKYSLVLKINEESVLSH